MPQKRSKKIRHIIEYALVRIILGPLRILPFQQRIKVGGAIVGTLIANLKPSRHRIEENIRIVFPNSKPDEIRKLTKAVGKNFGRSFIELLNNGVQYKHPDLRHASGPGIEVLRDAKSSGKGAIIVSGHFGQWDAARHFLKSEGMEIGAIYKPSSNPYFHKFFFPQIENAGKPNFPVGRRGTADMVRHLKNGGMVAILLDQRLAKGEELDFLGHSAKSSTSAASLALKYDIPMIPVYGIRREDSLDVDIVFEAPIPHTDAITMTQAANDSLAAQVRRNPGQWYWLHNRWN